MQLTEENEYEESLTVMCVSVFGRSPPGSE